MAATSEADVSSVVLYPHLRLYLMGSVAWPFMERVLEVLDDVPYVRKKRSKVGSSIVSFEVLTQSAGIVGPSTLCQYHLIFSSTCVDVVIIVFFTQAGLCHGIYNY